MSDTSLARFEPPVEPLHDFMLALAIKWITAAPDDPELVAAALTVELRRWLQRHGAIWRGFEVRVRAPVVEGASWQVCAFDEAGDGLSWSVLDEAVRNWS